jgi:imidazolonepropionase-like amidohydrolase
MLDVSGGTIVAPGEVQIRGVRIVSAGTHVDRPAGAEVIDLGDTTMMPGLIDVHVHLFLHPGDEGMQTVEESVSERTLIAAAAAKADLMTGFTAERDINTEGAAGTAVRNAINKGLIPGLRMRISGNAISITGGHENAIDFSPEQHVLSNATYADDTEDLIKAIREQIKLGADFIKIYETGRDSYQNGVFKSQYQCSEAELAAAVAETAARVETVVGVHCAGSLVRATQSRPVYLRWISGPPERCGYARNEGEAFFYHKRHVFEYRDVF